MTLPTSMVRMHGLIERYDRVYSTMIERTGEYERNLLEPGSLQFIGPTPLLVRHDTRRRAGTVFGIRPVGERVFAYVGVNPVELTRWHGRPIELSVGTRGGVRSVKLDDGTTVGITTGKRELLEVSLTPAGCCPRTFLEPGWGDFVMDEDEVELDWAIEALLERVAS